MKKVGELFIIEVGQGYKIAQMVTNHYYITLPEFFAIKENAQKFINKENVNQ